MEKRVFLKRVVKCIVILLFIGLVFFGVYNIYSVKKAREYADLEKLYERQNFAFCMDMNPYYQPFNEEHVLSLIENLAAYEEDTQTEEPVTVDDVKKYLKSEYTLLGKPAVLNMPNNIKNYIVWFWTGGERYRQKYDLWLFNYILDHPDKYENDYDPFMSEKTLYELIDDFKNCPDKEKYKYE